ncbi:MAG: nuclear transport factor 2 family protein [Acidobacteria bacterium]|nr:nuclear transport factor 2 family protein [Acidobacteriota bacterium]MCW5970044.1 nuclear transport factor 2 family protein [Blastocatellales bacterium]
MRSRIKLACTIVGICMLFAVAAGFRIQDSNASAAQGEAVADAMRGLSQRMVDAYERRDPDALRRLYKRQPDALFFWERRMSYSFDDISRTMGAIVDAVSNIKLTVTEFRSGGAGQTGWFAALFHIERTMKDGERSTSEGRWTVAAEKVGENWLIVHEHTSFPLPKP